MENRDRRGRFFRLGAALLAALLVALSVPLGAFASDDEDIVDAKDKVAELGDQYKELESKQKAINNKINAAKNEKEKKMAISQQLNVQIQTTTEQIDVLTDRIDALEASIQRKETEMQDKQTEIEANYELFRKRLRAMAETPKGSSLGMVLGVDSYSQFVTRSSVIQRVTAYDRQLMEELTKQKAELKEIKEEIETDKADVEDDKSAMHTKNTELGAQMAITKSQIQDIAAQEQEFLANKAEIIQLQKKLQAQMDAIYAEIARKSQKVPYVGGVMGWPTTGSLTQVSSNYGSRWGGSDNHTGIDITGGGAYGQPIYAANDGTVALVNTAYINGYAGGYGIYVIVDHGGGYTTLYGHCSKIVVSEGQHVTKGQKIAEIGSTGWSSGPHVHFEVRVNGHHTNPVQFLQG